MDLLTASASQLQDQLRKHEINTVQLVDACLEQINRHNKQGQRLNAVINATSPDVACKRAELLDEERAAGKLRGPMHGIPVIIKDIFPTDTSLGLPTTCGAYALRSAYGKTNCPLVQRLLDAGMIVLGKTNLNEYCRLRDVKSGWSALGGQTQSPYIEDGLAENESPIGNSTISGSSSGSAAGVAAGFAPVAIGTETTGSVVIPAHRGGLYSLKVTNAKAPKVGALCLSKEYDSVGVMTKTAADLRDMTDIILGKVDKTVRDKTASSPLRVGFVDESTWRFNDEHCKLTKEIRESLTVKYEQTIKSLQFSGTMQVVSNVPLQDEDIKYDGRDVIGMVVDAQFRENFAEFVAGLTGTEIKSVADLIAYNDEHADLALPKPYEDQKDLNRVNEVHEPEGLVEEAVEHCRYIAGPERLDKVMEECNVDLIVGPGDSGIFGLAARAGYPVASVPWTIIQYNDKDSRPEGLLVIGKADAEDTIVSFTLQYEELFPGRPLPGPLMKSSRV